MINKRSDPLKRSLTFDISKSFIELSKPNLKEYILKIEYLMSYENMGKVKVVLCGAEIGTIDGLDVNHAKGYFIDHAEKKVSIPQIKTYDDIHLKCPRSILDEDENKFNLEFIYFIDSNGPVNDHKLRKKAKFKLLSVDMCVQSIDII